jgi:hypothetical protein
VPFVVKRESKLERQTIFTKEGSNKKRESKMKREEWSQRKNGNRQNL